ncbi:uncharacterized protein LOC131851634 [Achroia grisella]|uniref:uncharacterized protein LOC131851634 n=1 Tax=Achroia grisella TaxID=688607 RepID=UPI0027D2C046|nr:uncharacterized protein LOC131851634 [Achroia grisella]
MDDKHKKPFDERSGKDGVTKESVKDGVMTESVKDGGNAGSVKDGEAMEMRGLMSAEDAAAFSTFARELELAERELALGSDYLSSSCMSLVEDEDAKTSSIGTRRSSRRKRHRTDPNSGSESEYSGRSTPAPKRVGQSPSAGVEARTSGSKVSNPSQEFGYRFYEDEKFIEPVSLPPKRKGAISKAITTDGSKEARAGLKQVVVSQERLRDSEIEPPRSSEQGAPAPTSGAEASQAIRSVRMQVYQHAEEITEVIRRSANIKGTCIKTMKDGMASIKRLVDALEASLIPSFASPLLAQNIRLEQEVEFLKREVAELRAEKNKAVRAAKKAEAPAANTGEVQGPVVGSEMKAWRAQIMRDIDGIVKNRLSSFMSEMSEYPFQHPEMGSVPPPVIMQEKSGQAAPATAVRGSAPNVQAGPKTKAKGPEPKKALTQGDHRGPREEVAQSELPTTSWATVVKGKRGKLSSVPEGLPGEPWKSQKQASGKQPNKRSAPAPSKLRPPSSAAVIITMDPQAEKEGASYANILREAKSKIDLGPLGIDALRLRVAVTGGRILEIPGVDSGEKADALAAKLRELVPEEVARVSRPTKQAEMRLMGLDDSVGVEEIAAAIASAGDCQVQDVKVGDVRRNPTGAGACWVRAPIRAVKAITTAAKLKVGWVVVRAELLRQRQLRCFRCLEVGHARPVHQSGGSQRSLLSLWGERPQGGLMRVCAAVCGVYL